MIRNMNDTYDRWQSGLPEEVAFWRETISTQGWHWPDEYQRRLNPDEQLQGFAERLIEPTQSLVTILDIGAGPMTKLGKKSDKFEFQLIAADCLAHEYDRLLAEFGVIPPIRTIYAEVERLSTYFPANSFDLVHMCNALDHSYDPVEGIRQMLYVVKPGGVVHLAHYENEGAFEKYSGLHQWNFTLSDEGDFMIWSPETSVNISTLFRDQAQLQSRRYRQQPRNNIVLNLRKPACPS